MKPIVLPIIAMFLSFSGTDTITGRWESKPSVNGNVTGVVFKEDNTYDGYINKKPFVSGTFTYSSKDSLFTIEDGGCAEIVGTYKINFFSNGDSMSFRAISDDCTGRKGGMERTVLGRVK